MLLTHQLDDAWSARGFSSFLEVGEESFLLLHGRAGRASLLPGTGRSQPQHTPLADLPARSRQGWQWAAAHPDRLLAPLTSEPGKKSAATLEQERNEYRYRILSLFLFPFLLPFLFLLTLASGHSISAASSSKSSHHCRYLDRHL